MARKLRLLHELEQQLAKLVALQDLAEKAGKKEEAELLQACSLAALNIIVYLKASVLSWLYLCSSWKL